MRLDHNVVDRPPCWTLARAKYVSSSVSILILSEHNESLYFHGFVAIR